jgi:hypothetical protein
VGEGPASGKGGGRAAGTTALGPQLDKRSAIERGAHLLALSTLRNAEIPFVVAGAYALHAYTGVYRVTKDLDIFLRRQDVDRALESLAEVSFRTEMLDPVWLAKAYATNDYFVDLIFSSGNGVTEVDDQWMTRGKSHVIHGLPVLVAPPEEVIWSKAFVCERERFDGADVNHIIYACAEQMDWRHLLSRFGPYWQVLLAHLAFFRFSYPGHADKVPRWLWLELLRRAGEERSDPSLARLCRGTLLSRTQYEIDLDLGGFQDARMEEVESYRAYHGEDGTHRGGG